MKVRRPFLFVLLLRALCVLCVTSVLAPAQAEPAENALRQFVDRVDSLSAKFEQVQTDDQGKLLQTTSGRVWLQRPEASAKSGTGKFRWAYEKPYEQLLLCDGKTIWLFDPDLAQVTVRPAEQTLAGTPVELLARRGSLEKQFTVTDGGLSQGVRRIKLSPKATDSDFKEIELWLRNGVPQRLRFNDPLGGVNEVSFSEIQTNAAVDQKLFTFQVPKGVEVIKAEESK